MKKFKRVLKYIIYIFLIFFILILLPIFSYRKESNINPLPSSYKKGVYHIHSIFSDGKGDIDEITKAASVLNLDFVILTDHGIPNPQSSKATSWLNGVLLIGGSEFSLHSGHLAAMGFDIPEYFFPPEPQEAINDVINNNGVCFISHPFDDKIPWSDWDIEDFTGIEILSSYSSARKAGLINMLAFPVKYLFNSNYALLSSLRYPQENISKWDALNKNGRYLGIYALDAHAKLEISENFQLNFPSYQSMFNILNTYVKIDRELERDPHQSSSTIISSLKKGNFFNVIEAIAPANGFDAYYLDNQGKITNMGEISNSLKGKLIIKLPFNFETDIQIKKNGHAFESLLGNMKNTHQIKIEDPGVYRLEIYVSHNQFNDLPWIITNPFYIGTNFKKVEKKKYFLSRLLVDKEEFFTIEKNNFSDGKIITEKNVNNELVTTFDFLLKKQEDKTDFWTAMASREKYDFTGYSGFFFEAKSNKKIRFWIEYRIKTYNSETWYRHSFLAEKQWKKIAIPFNKFFVILGKRTEPQLSKITAIFLAINNVIAPSGTKGSISFKNIGLY